MKDFNKELRDELQAAGARPDELASLEALAGSLAQLSTEPAPLFRFTRPVRPRWQRLHVPAAALACLVVVVGLVYMAQSSLPGEKLYGVKRLSENTAVALHSSYRATVMIHRAEEVKELVAHNAASQKVLATLADYSAQAAMYKMPSYSTLEYCKANLVEARAFATPAEQRAIDVTLARLRDV